jgi:broad specificity phosphatase PhoE
LSALSSLDSPLVCLLRHGETPFTVARRYNGVTDAPLTEGGEVLARRLEPVLSEISWDQVLCSNLTTARRTAELAGFADPLVKPILHECDYGAFEGKTTEKIFAEWPGWDFWHDGCPDGESAEQVAARLRPLIDELRRSEGRTLISVIRTPSASSPRSGYA